MQVIVPLQQQEEKLGMKMDDGEEKIGLTPNDLSMLADAKKVLDDQTERTTEGTDFLHQDKVEELQQRIENLKFFSEVKRDS